jgi:hypothetical protein
LTCFQTHGTESLNDIQQFVSGIRCFFVKRKTSLSSLRFGFIQRIGAPAQAVGCGVPQKRRGALFSDTL